VRKAEIDLASATCRVDFDLVLSSPNVMADVFVDALRTASTSGGNAHWWQRGPRWSTLTAYRSFGNISLWETHTDATGRRRLIHRGHVRDRATSSRLADSVASLEGVERCQISLWSHQITVICGQGAGPMASRTVDRIERILEGRRAADSAAGDFTSGDIPFANGGPVPIATGLKRLAYVALAGGAFTLTMVGLVVPGVPTVPFLLATSYYLARSSPSMDERLHRTAFFGPILQEWEGHGALSPTSKGKLVALTVTIVVVTVVLAPLTPFTLVVILLISSLSVYGVTRIPAIAKSSQNGACAGIEIALPLPAH
jgi:uncharacterized membrane protein YbaN (DUF454 family)